MQVKKIQESGNKAREEVIKALLNGVTNVKPEVPERIEIPS